MGDVSRAVVLAGIRTPIGRYGGALSGVRPDDLAGLVIREVVARSGVEPAQIEDVWFGCANQAGEDNRNVARMGALLAGLPDTVAGVTVNRLCASGLSAVVGASHAVIAGAGYTAGIAWAFLYYPSSFSSWMRITMNALWVGGLLLIVGWASVDWPTRLLGAAGGAAVLALLPPVVGLAPTTGTEWLGAVVGILFGSLAHRPGAREKRHLVRGAIHHGFVGPEYFLGAVAVVNVEIDDRDALGSMVCLGMARRDGGIVEQAEAHRPFRLGVMAGRPYGNEGIGGTAAHHFVDRVNRAADGAQCRLETAGRHRRIGIEMHHAFARGRIANRRDIFHRVA